MHFLLGTSRGRSRVMPPIAEPARERVEGARDGGHREGVDDAAAETAGARHVLVGRNVADVVEPEAKVAPGDAGDLVEHGFRFRLVGTGDEDAERTAAEAAVQLLDETVGLLDGS